MLYSLGSVFGLYSRLDPTPPLFSYFAGPVQEDGRINGSWGEWSAFTDCSAPCGGGVTSRDRACDSPPPIGGGAECEGQANETLACNDEICPSNVLSILFWAPIGYVEYNNLCMDFWSNVYA